ncbi:MAG: DUF523 domain-containing protein [bacterium]
MSKKKIQYIASACLCGIPCRYDGKAKPNNKVIELMQKGEVFPVCPEVFAGEKTPRPAATRQKNGRILENESGKDITDIYKKGASQAMNVCKSFDIKKSFLKKGSPTCGEDGIFTELLQVNGIETEIKDKGDE